MAELAAGLGAIQQTQQQKMGNTIYAQAVHNSNDGANVTVYFTGHQTLVMTFDSFDFSPQGGAPGGIPDDFWTFLNKGSWHIDGQSNYGDSIALLGNLILGQKTNLGKVILRAHGTTRQPAPQAPQPPSRGGGGGGGGGGAPSYSYASQAFALRGVPDGLGADAPPDPNAWSTGQKVAAVAGGAAVLGGIVFLATRKPKRRRR